MSVAEGIQQQPSEPATRPASAAGRFVFIDGLRGVAALWVVVFHAHEAKHMELLWPLLPGGVQTILKGGFLGVQIFFVLSGFVIAHSLHRAKIDAKYFGRFALRRSIRLDPPYWASIFIAIAVGVFSTYVVAGKTYHVPSFDMILAHLFYLEDILLYEEVIPIYWTLCLEIQFYMIFCLLLGVAQRFRRDETDRRSLFAVFMPALFIAALWPLGILPENMRPLGLFLPQWYGFLLGVFACWAMNGTVRPIWFHAYVLVLAAGAVINAKIPAAACLIAAELIVAAAFFGGLKLWLNWRWLQFLGLISYSLYLFHTPITGCAYNVGYRLTGRSAATEALWFVLVLATNVGGAFAMWWLIERPSHQLSRRIRLQNTEDAKRNG